MIENESETAELSRWQRKEARRGRRKSKACPTCKRPDVLSDFEAARGYQCYQCTIKDQGGIDLGY